MIFLGNQNPTHQHEVGFFAANTLRGFGILFYVDWREVLKKMDITSEKFSANLTTNCKDVGWYEKLEK